jgi:hypothetical protein
MDSFSGFPQQDLALTLSPSFFRKRTYQLAQSNGRAVKLFIPQNNSLRAGRQTDL